MSLEAVKKALAGAVGNPSDDPEPVLDAEEIESAESVDEVVELYNDMGTEFESLLEAYKRVQKDYWNSREKVLEPEPELEFDETEVGEKSLYIAGIAHGLDAWGMRLSPEVEEALKSEVGDLEASLGEGQILVFEDQLDDHLFEELKESPNVHGLNDLDSIREELDERKLLTKFSGFFEEYLLMPAVSVYMKRNALLAEDYDSRKYEMQKVDRKSLKDPEWIGNSQKRAEYARIPFDLEEEFMSRITDQFGEKFDESRANIKEIFGEFTSRPYRIDKIPGIVYEAKDAVFAFGVTNLYATGKKQREERSEKMGEELLEKLEEYEEVYLVVGSNHKPQIENYMEEVNAEEIYFMEGLLGDLSDSE